MSHLKMCKECLFVWDPDSLDDDGDFCRNCESNDMDKKISEWLDIEHACRDLAREHLPDSPVAMLNLVQALVNQLNLAEARINFLEND